MSSAVAVLATYLAFACSIAGLAVWAHNDLFFAALILPVIFSAFYFNRRIYVPMQGIATLAAGIAAVQIFGNPIPSLRTIAIVTTTTLIVCEPMFRVRRAQRNALLALQQSENRLRATIEAQPDGVQLLGADGNILEINPAGLAIFEASSLSDLPERNMQPMVLPKHWPTAQRLIDHGLRGQADAAEIEINTLKGSRRTLLLRAAPLRDEDGRITACLALAHDITALKRSEKRGAVLSKLGRDLSAVNTPREAAQTLLGAAQELLGWDACTFDLYWPKERRNEPILYIDTVDGQQLEIPAQDVEVRPDSFSHRVITEGPKLVHREKEQPGANTLVRFGDKSRPSASLAFVPIQDGSNVMGVLSIQSYQHHAYDEEDLETLQDLANHGAGALKRIRETTERQRAEEELRQSEIRFQTVVENLGESLLITDLDDVVLYANSRMFDLTGYAPEELIGRPAYEQIVPRESWAELQRKNRQRAQGISEEYELILQRKDGKRIWAEVHATPFLRSDGAVIGTIGAMTDITERKRSETRTHAFSRLAQQLSATNTPHEAAGIIVDAAQQLLGWDACTLDLYSADQGVVVPLVSIDTIDGARVHVAHPFAGKPPSPMMHRLIAEGAQLVLRSPDAAAAGADSLTPFGDTGRRSASLLFVPIRNGEKVIGSLSIQSYTPNAYARDDLKLLQALGDHCAGALERLDAVNELRRSEERFSKAFRSSPIALGICDLEGGSLLDANESLLRLLGYGREELIGQRLFELPVWAEEAEKTQLSGALEERRSVRDLGCRFRTRGQQVRTTLTSAELMDLAGAPCVLLIIQDITERLDLEMQLRQSQKMEALGQLSASVAHDFNNLLTIIQGHLGFLSGRLDLDEESKESVRQLSTTADHASNLTRQLLAFSRRQVMQPEPLDLNRVVENAAKLLHRLLGDSVVLEFTYAPRLPRVHADPGMIHQVILNLAVNARDAMPNGGKLVLGTKVVEISDTQPLRNQEARPGKFVRLRVADTGCGMDTETLAHIFEPFFTTKEVGKGTGLGLATVYGIVKQHEGWIELDSQVGRGATFDVFLPSRVESGTPVEAPEPKEVRGGTETILVVEDEPVLRNLVRRILEKHGYRVILAVNGGEAMAIWNDRKQEIDLLLTDMVMPGELSGAQLAAMLKADRPKLKIIYTSGYSIDLYGLNQELREGINFLPKPYHPPALGRIVRECLDRET